MSERPTSTPIDSSLKPGERPTLKTISRATGLAIATVSRALHDAPDIGQETKRRVNEVAKAIGYRPNRAGVRLRTGKTNVISLVISTEHEMINQHTGRLISSIAGELRDTPYHLIVTPYFPSEDLMTPINYIIESGSADAIIMNQTEEHDKRVAHLMKIGFPFVTHGRTKWAENHSFFDFDNAKFAEIGVQTFADRGRKNVLIVAPPETQYYSQHMKSGAKSKARDLGINLEILSTATSDSPTAVISKAITDHIAAHPKTDAIICPSTLAAMTITAAIESIGLKIGDEIDLFSKQADDFLEKFRPGILSVIEDMGRTGKFLAQAALHTIAHPNAAPKQLLDTPELKSQTPKS